MTAKKRTTASSKAKRKAPSEQVALFDYEEFAPRSAEVVLAELFYFRRYLEHDGLAWLFRNVVPLDHFYQLSASQLRQLFAAGNHSVAWAHSDLLASQRQHDNAHRYGERLLAALERPATRGRLLLTRANEGGSPLSRSTLPVDWMFQHSDRADVELHGPVVAVIGSRQSSREQLSIAGYIAESVGALRGTVITGLATGADAAAHRAARASEAQIIAVLGSGVGKVYPAEHTKFVRELMAGRGTVLTELPPDQSANQMTFVLRNRIVAALADVVVAVSGRYSSGTAHTVRFAMNSGTPAVSVDPDVNSGISRLVAEMGGEVLSVEAFVNRLTRAVE